MFEYKFVEFQDILNGNDPNVTKSINALGAEGWELVSVATHINRATMARRTEAIFYFKRPIVPSAT